MLDAGQSASNTWLPGLKVLEFVLMVFGLVVAWDFKTLVLACLWLLLGEFYVQKVCFSSALILGVVLDRF